VPPSSPRPHSRRPGAPNRVRIIGGSHRGRVIRFPPLAGLRPTPDRVRETLFNWLGQDLGGRACLDLYAGSGALALEALSRGARVAVAVDRERSLVDALAATAQDWGLAGLEVHQGDARRYVARETRRFDVVFLDPPFAEDPWPWLLPSCAGLLAAGGVLYAEAARALDPPPSLTLRRSAVAGQVHYHLFAS